MVFKNKKILGILLYGSHAQGNSTNRSDIDICVVAPKEELNQLLSFILKNINVNKKKYDTRMFAELPLYVQIQVIENGILVYSHNKFDLYEYFYFYRKLWEDQKCRQKFI
ncbi:MAG TPA: nucleotidyltransferase domain-containing protein [Candidatus Lokiarchaeia archaeon]